MARKEGSWRLGEFSVLGANGKRQRVVGSVSGRFGLFDRMVKANGVTSRVTYLARVVTCEVLAPFATRRDARLAAQVLADLAVDGSDNEAVIERWQRAGFYQSGFCDDGGNFVWKLLGGQLTEGYAWGALGSEGQSQWLH